MYHIVWYIILGYCMWPKGYVGKLITLQKTFGNNKAVLHQNSDLKVINFNFENHDNKSLIWFDNSLWWYSSF